MTEDTIPFSLFFNNLPAKFAAKGKGSYFALRYFRNEYIFKFFFIHAVLYDRMIIWPTLLAFQRIDQNRFDMNL